MSVRTILALETSGPGGSVALIRAAGIDGDFEVLAEENFSEQRRQAAELAPRMKSVLNGISHEELDAVAVSVGPGSYTGLRVGVSGAKAFCWAAKIPLAPVCSLEALAYEVAAIHPDETESAGGRIVACRDAFGGQVYVRRMARSGPGALKDLPFPGVFDQGLPQVLAPKAFLEMMSPPAVVVGSGVARCVETLAEGALDEYVLRESPSIARAVTIGRLAAARPERDRKGNDVHAVCPVYLRKSSSEIQRESNEPSAT